MPEPYTHPVVHFARNANPVVAGMGSLADELFASLKREQSEQIRKAAQDAQARGELFNINTSFSDAALRLFANAFAPVIEKYVEDAQLRQDR